jgi:hypothetical protein
MLYFVKKHMQLKGPLNQQVCFLFICKADIDLKVFTLQGYPFSFLRKTLTIRSLKRQVRFLFIYKAYADLKDSPLQGFSLFSFLRKNTDFKAVEPIAGLLPSYLQGKVPHSDLKVFILHLLLEKVQ